ncbi:LysM peptidoglycan-binding domain-containing protein [Actinoplanes sp. NPDC051859]|uniref:LysM peptidoglycan-binding domain-containing protein n=1 Tax=Actinoplanes sp. NPDC051859 TaxID=3363909 RepID=UPI00378A6D28
MVATGVRPTQPVPLRLTRRGRIVLLTLFFVLASVASAVLWTTASRAASDDRRGALTVPAHPLPTVIVQPHDTLWSIAERAVPGRAPREVIAEIQALNGIKHRYVYAGEELTVPHNL